MNQAICIRGVEGAEITFFEFWSHPVCIPVIPGYTERVELNAGLKMFVHVHLRLGMNQRSRYVFDRPKSACSRFRGGAELGYLGSPTKRPRVRSSRCGSELLFRASSSTIPISNLVWYERQTPLVAHSPRVARGAPPSRWCGLPCFIHVFFLCFWPDNRHTRAGAALRAAPSERGWAMMVNCAIKPAHAVPLASARQRPETPKGKPGRPFVCAIRRSAR